MISLAITSAISGIQNNSKYFRASVSSEPVFMPGLPVNRKCGCSTPDYALNWLRIFSMERFHLRYTNDTGSRVPVQVLSWLACSFPFSKTGIFKCTM
jgi:hypothetical protein